MLLLPVSKKDELFGVIESAMRLHFADRSTNIKDFFFPQKEDIAAFKTGKRTIEIETLPEYAEDFALYGVTACDFEGLNILDRVFLKEPADMFYKKRREKGVAIASACFGPFETCFCGALGTDCAEPAGDVAVYEAGENLYWKSKTEKGAALTEKVRHLFKEAEENDMAVLAEEQGRAREILRRLPLGSFSFEGIPDWRESFNSAVWEELCKTCLSCGTCTFVCPACHCYDVRDMAAGEGAVRYRCWDSCMYQDFTEMSHGNPRETPAARFRQRYMHKLHYFPENNGGVIACTGCGRCVGLCPISMNIVRAANTLREARHVQA